MEEPLVRQPSTNSGKIITHNAHLLMDDNGNNAYHVYTQNGRSVEKNSHQNQDMLSNVQLDDYQNGGSYEPSNIVGNDDGYLDEDGYPGDISGVTQDGQPDKAMSEGEENIPQDGGIIGRPETAKSHSSELSRQMDNSPVDEGRQSADSLDEESRYQQELKERVKRSYADLGMEAEGILLRDDDEEIVRDSLEINEDLPYDQLQALQRQGGAAEKSLDEDGGKHENDETDNPNLPADANQELQDDGNYPQDVEEPYQSNADVEDPYQSHADVEDPYQSHADVEDPYQSHADVEDPYQSHADVEDPYQSHADVEDPYQSHADVEVPYLSNADVEDPYRSHADLEDPYQSHASQDIVEEYANQERTEDHLGDVEEGEIGISNQNNENSTEAEEYYAAVEENNDQYQEIKKEPPEDFSQDNRTEAEERGTEQFSDANEQFESDPQIPETAGQNEYDNSNPVHDNQKEFVEDYRLDDKDADGEIFRDSLEDDENYAPDVPNVNNNAEQEQMPSPNETSGRSYANVVQGGGNDDYPDPDDEQGGDNEGYPDPDPDENSYGYENAEEPFGNGYQDNGYADNNQNYDRGYGQYPLDVGQNENYGITSIPAERDLPVENHIDDGYEQRNVHRKPSASQKSSAGQRKWQIDAYGSKDTGGSTVEEQQVPLSAAVAAPQWSEEVQHEINKDEELKRSRGSTRSRAATRSRGNIRSRESVNQGLEKGQDVRKITNQVHDVAGSKPFQNDMNENYYHPQNVVQNQNDYDPESQQTIHDQPKKVSSLPLHRTETNPFTVSQVDNQVEPLLPSPPPQQARRPPSLPPRGETLSALRSKAAPPPAQVAKTRKQSGKPPLPPTPPSQSYEDMAHQEMVRTKEDKNAQLRSASSASSYLEKHKSRQSPQRFSPQNSAKFEVRNKSGGKQSGRQDVPAKNQKIPRETLESAKGYQGYGRRAEIPKSTARKENQVPQENNRKDSSNNLGSMVSLDSLRFQGLPREQSQTLSSKGYQRQESTVLQKLPSGETLEVAYISDDSDDDDLHFVDDMGNPVDNSGKRIDSGGKINDVKRLEYRIKPTPPKNRQSAQNLSGVPRGLRTPPGKASRQVSATSEKVSIRGYSGNDRKVSQSGPKSGSKANQGLQFPSAYGLRRQVTMDKAVGESKAPSPAEKQTTEAQTEVKEELITKTDAAFEGLEDSSLPPSVPETQNPTTENSADGGARVSAVPQEINQGIISPGGVVPQGMPLTNPLQASLNGQMPGHVVLSNQPAVFSPNSSLTFAQPMYTQIQPVAMSPVQTILQPVIQSQTFAQPVYMGAAAPYAQQPGQFAQQPQYVFPQQQLQMQQAQQQFQIQQQAQQQLQMQQQAQQQFHLQQQAQHQFQLQQQAQQQFQQQQQQAQFQQQQMQMLQQQQPLENPQLNQEMELPRPQTYNVKKEGLEPDHDEDAGNYLNDDEVDMPKNASQRNSKNPNGVRALLAERSKASKPTKTKPVKATKNFIDANKNNVKNEDNSKSYKKMFSAKKRAKSEPMNRKKPLPNISQEAYEEDPDYMEGDDDERGMEAWTRQLIMEQQQLRRNHSESDVFNRSNDFGPIRQRSLPPQDMYDQPYFKGNFATYGGPMARNQDQFYSWSADRAAQYARMQMDPRISGPKIAFAENPRGSFGTGGNMTDDERQRYANLPKRISPFNILPDIANGNDVRISDPNGYLVKLHKQREPPTYKEYTLKDYRGLKNEVRMGGLGPDMAEIKARQEKVQRQRQYAKAVMEQNKKVVQTKPWQPPPSRLSKEELASKRKMALQYAKNIPKPRIPTPPEELHERMYGSSQSQNARQNEQRQLMNELAHLDELADRHRREKEQVERLKSGEGV